jgi:hypothetical protein
MFRPITRRWGIRLHSTQRYTVWRLTPRKRAASRTVIGYLLALVEHGSFLNDASAMVASVAFWSHHKRNSRFRVALDILDAVVSDDVRHVHHHCEAAWRTSGSYDA